MRIHLIAVGRRMPPWVEQGYHDFAKRLPAKCSLSLAEVPTAKRRKGLPLSRLVEQEGTQMLSMVPRDARIIAMDEQGEQWTTRVLANKLQGWLQGGQDIALLIGGPDGLAPSCREGAHELWSLSTLTLPHSLCRIIVAEQLYRAWSMLEQHPYHRGD